MVYKDWLIVTRARQSCEGYVSRPLHFSEAPEEGQKGFKLKNHILLVEALLEI